MSAASAPKRGSREVILDAADALIRELGVNRMTLDAVAARAGLSKGGLLYNFPSKEALLKGMIGRFAASLNVASGGSVASRIAELRLAKLENVAEDQKASHGMLAAIAEDPSLLDPIRDAHRALWAEMKSSEKDPDTSLLVWLAIEGLMFFEMFETSPLSAGERDAVIARLKAIAAA
ncbi:MAG: TetR/AcrR family transcriptional regulator [Micropepsaceae bacterium]